MSIIYKDNEQILIEIKKLMLDSKITQREIAEKLSIKPQGLTKLLNKKNFGFEDAKKILDAMGSVSYTHLPGTIFKGGFSGYLKQRFVSCRALETDGAVHKQIPLVRHNDGISVHIHHGFIFRGNIQIG